MENIGIVGVGAITVICYLIGEATKASGLNNKWIPIVCGFFGGILGICGKSVMADFPAQDIITASAVGIVSGLASTGANQIFKQFSASK